MLRNLVAGSTSFPISSLRNGKEVSQTRYGSAEIQVGPMVIRGRQSVDLPHVWSSNQSPYCAQIHAEAWFHIQSSDQTCREAESFQSCGLIQGRVSCHTEKGRRGKGNNLLCSRIFCSHLRDKGAWLFSERDGAGSANICDSIRCNMISAVSNRRGMRFMIFEEAKTP